MGEAERGQQRATVAADVHDVVVGAPVQAVVQEVGRPVRQQRVALHLPEADAAPELAALDRLPRQRVDRPRRPYLPPRCPYLPFTWLQWVCANSTVGGEAGVKGPSNL